MQFLYQEKAKVKANIFNYSEVFKARNKSTPMKYVAMKKVLMENEKEGVSFEQTDIFLFFIKV